MPVSLRKKQEEEKNLPKVAWTIKKIENELVLPKSVNKESIARLVMMEEDPKKVAAKIKEINAAEKQVQALCLSGRRIPIDSMVNGLRSLLKSKKGAEDFVENPNVTINGLADILDAVLKDWIRTDAWTLHGARFIGVKQFDEKLVTLSREFENKDYYALGAAVIFEFSKEERTKILEFIAARITPENYESRGMLSVLSKSGHTFSFSKAPGDEEIVMAWEWMQKK